MHRALFMATALLAALAAVPAAAATYAFSFTSSDATASGSGHFTTAAAAPALVTAISGTLTDSTIGPGIFTITGLSPYAGSDNMLLAAAPFVTFGGISFTTDTAGAFNFGLGGPNAPYGLILNVEQYNPGGFPGVGTPGALPIEWTVSQVPEPASWTLLLIGFGLVGATMRRRTATVAA